MSQKAKYQSKNNQKYNKSNFSPSSQRTSIWLLLPIILILSVLPFITKLKEYNKNLSNFPWFTYNDLYTDFFLYYKQKFFLTIVFIMALIVIIKACVDKRNIVYSNVLIPLGIYGALALISSIVSKYRKYSFAGVHAHFESVFVLLGYCLIVYYCLQVIKTEEDVRLIVNCFVISILVMALLGLTQYIGKDFFATNLGKKLILPRSHWGSMNDLQFNFEKHRVYMTFYNPNYVGSYSAMAVSFITVLAVLTRKNKWMIPIYILADIGIFICLIGSKSKTGIIALVVASIFTLVILSKKLIKYFYFTVPMLLLVVSVVVLFNKANDNILLNSIKQATVFNKSEPPLKEIITGDDEVIIKYNEEELHVKYFAGNDFYGNFVLTDANNMPVIMEFDYNNGDYTIKDDRFPNFKLGFAKYEDIPLFYVTIDNYNWYFTNQTDDGTYYYMNNYGKLDKIIKAPYALFSGYEGYASGRGYIWSRTIPLLKKYFILGSGADTFMMVFPQQDYVGLYNYGYGDQLLTKPHNMYLQMGVQTGVLSLIAFLVFYAMYFISSLKLYIKGKFKSYYAQVGVAVLVASLSYIILGIANDSSLTVAPVFWSLIGLGIVVNKLAKPYIEEDTEQDKAQ
mgnify:FL=1